MMKRFLFCPFLLFVFSAFYQSVSAKVWINEVMQSNIDGIVDDLHDFPDSWLELYNDGNSAIDLKNWYVSETANYNQGWKIPQSVTIPAKGFVILYFDKVGQGRHADFRIDSGKTQLYLFNASQTKEDSADIPKQPAPGIAYGRTQNGGSTWGYFIKATPEKTNAVAGNTSAKLAPNPVFSRSGGVSDKSITLNLSIPNDAPAGILKEHIHYTTDGSEPTEDSPVYENSLTFSKPNASVPYEIRATVVKAKIIAPGFLINRSVAHTYIITNRKLDLPVISLSLNSEYLFDPEFGIYTDGNGKYGLTGNCRDNQKVNWNNDWRRPANIEYFPSQNEKSAFNQLVEIRIAGGCSRGHAQKSLIIYANKRFGEKRFNYQLFNEKPDQEIKSFMIRNSGNDFGQMHFRDAAIQLLMGGKVDLDYQAYQPAIIFINGAYYGLENIRERSNEDFVLANYELEEEEIDMLEKTKKDRTYDTYWELKTGDMVAFNEMTERIKTPSEKLSYEELAEFVDIEEFINYNILQMYALNRDYPGNNIVIWRPRNTENAKWRYIVKDTDFGLGHNGELNSENPFDAPFLASNDDTRLLRRLLDKPEFRDAFIDHFAVYMGDLLHKTSTTRIIDSIKQLIESEVLYHRQRFNMGNVDQWENYVGKAISWLENRNYYMYRNMKNYFELENNIPMTLSISPEVTGTTSVIINDIKLQKNEFDGQYFIGRPLRIRWEGSQDSNILGWKITAKFKKETTSTEIYKKEIEYTIPESCVNVKFVAIHDPDYVNVNANAITENSIQTLATNDGITISNLNGLTTVTVIDVSGRLVGSVTTGNTSVHFPIRENGVFLVKITNQNKTITAKVLK